jgi:hypothetical protein
VPERANRHHAWPRRGRDKDGSEPQHDVAGLGDGSGSGCCASFGRVQTCRGTRFVCGVASTLWQMTPSVISHKVSNFAQIGRRDRAKTLHGKN